MNYQITLNETYWKCNRKLNKVVHMKCNTMRDVLKVYSISEILHAQSYK